MAAHRGAVPGPPNRVSAVAVHFDLNELDISSGENVTQLEYFTEIMEELQTSGPSGPTVTAPVESTPINYIFAGGPEPVPYESGDADCSRAVDIDE